MKVVHICQRDSLAEGGAAKVAVELAQRMGNCEVETKVIFAYGNQGDLSAGADITSIWLGISSNREALTGMLRLWKTLKSFEPDIIHHHDGLSWTHLVSKLYSSAKKIGHAHFNAPQAYASAKVRWARKLQISTYDYLIAVSKFTLDAWTKAGFPASSSSVVPNGVDESEFTLPTETQRKTARKTLGLPSGAKIALSVGRLHVRMKGTDDFIRILSELDEQWHGVIAGVGADEKMLKTLAGTLGVEHRLHFCGLVDPVISCYHAADILVVTSHFEPFGLMVIEALSCGLPLAGFPCEGGATDLLSEAEALTTDHRDTADLSLKISEYFKLDPAVRRRDAENRRKLVEANYSWAKSTASNLKIYKEAL